MMREFYPKNVPVTIAEINLSFNKLTTIPLCIKELLDANPNVSINLKNNDFWFSMYSNLPHSMMRPETKDELALAYRLNLVSTQRLLHSDFKPIDTRNGEKSSNNDTNTNTLWNTKDLLKNKIEQTGTTSSNGQNIHLNSVQSLMKNNIAFVMEYKPVQYITRHVGQFMKLLKKELGMSKRMKNYVSKLCEHSARHSVYGVSFYDLLYKVYCIINDSKHRIEMLCILKQELEDGKNTCLTGQMTRLLQ